jgi:hypothetical protein
MKLTTILLVLAMFPTALAQLPADSRQFIRVEAPVVVLTHVRIIDGTGAQPLEDQTLVIVAKSWGYHPAAAFLTWALPV